MRAIGPECGDAVFGGEMYAGAKAQYSIDERQRVAEEFLEANLVKVLSMHVALERVRPAAAEAQRLYTQIRTLIPDILDQLKLVRRNGFELVVSLAVELPEDASEEIAVVGPRGLERGLTTDAASQVSFGYLPDTPMLYSRFQPVKDHADVAQLLAALPRAASKEEAFDWICDNSRLDHLEQGVRMMRRASHLYLRMIERLDRFNSFFTRRNFTALNKWGQHPNNAFDLKAEVNLERFSLSHSGRGRWEHEELVLTPNMAALTARGDWPGFE
ncbi:hypothetical protein [Hyphomicrobium sp. 1Nfss2.1]|uniref:hypothetical protein n=1 Tax=Hyphomicrobium sp. 1Nfss2.1 TaxID=3413936 RepID=UPI003C7EC415